MTRLTASPPISGGDDFLSSNFTLRRQFHLLSNYQKSVSDLLKSIERRSLLRVVSQIAQAWLQQRAGEMTLDSA
jgi:hypothetical protein